MKKFPYVFIPIFLEQWTYVHITSIRMHQMNHYDSFPFFRVNSHRKHSRHWRQTTRRWLSPSSSSLHTTGIIRLINGNFKCVASMLFIFAVFKAFIQRSHPFFFSQIYHFITEHRLRANVVICVYGGTETRIVCAASLRNTEYGRYLAECFSFCFGEQQQQASFVRK